MADISKITALDGITYDIKAKKSLAVPIATVDSTSTNIAFTVQVPEFENETELRDGLFFYIYNNKVASTTNCTIQVNDFAAKPIYDVNGTRVTTTFAKNCMFPIWYNSTLVDGGCWVIGFLTNTTYSVFTALTQGTGSGYLANSVVYRYQLLFQMDETYVTPLNNTSNSTNTTKTMLTNVEFDPFGDILYYNTTGTIDADARVPGGNSLYTANLDLRYTFNCGSTLTAYAPFYLVVDLQSNGKAKIASTTPWSQTLPSTNDGYYYILLGRTYSAYQISLYRKHPVYYHDGVSIQELLPGNQAFIENITVGANTANTFTMTPEWASGRMPIVTFGIPTVLVDTTTVSFSKDGDNDWYISTENPISGLTVNHMTDYTVMFSVEWDGTEYKLFGSLHGDKKGVRQTAAANSNYVWEYIGNTNPLGYSASVKERECPFVIVHDYLKNNDEIYIISYDTEATHTIKVTQIPFTSEIVEPILYAETCDGKPVVRLGSSNSLSVEECLGNASGWAAHAEGNTTTAHGYASHAEGYLTIAGNYGHSEGSLTEANGQVSHAEGSYSKADGNASHAEGQRSVASGAVAHAEGSNTVASGSRSHAEGEFTIANHHSQHVFGQYNVADSSAAAATARGNYVEIVGNGTADNARSNARTLDWNGNEVLAGKLTVGSAPTNNMDVATKKYVDDGIAEKISAPASPVTGSFLVYNGIAWVAQTLQTWQGGNY